MSKTIPSNTFPKARLARLKELAAELALLRLYNDQRIRAGHDFGCGQRGAEISRRKRALEEACSFTSRPCPSAYELERDVTKEELLVAFRTIGQPRYDRAVREGYETPGSRRTRNTWRGIARYVGAEKLTQPLRGRDYRTVERDGDIVPIDVYTGEELEL